MNSGGAGVGCMGRAPWPSPSRRGSKTTGHPTPADPSCGHLALCPALPRAHRVKTFWPFLFQFLSPLQLLRGAWSPCCSSLPLTFQPWGAEDEAAAPILPSPRLACLLWGTASAGRARVVLRCGPTQGFGLPLSCPLSCLGLPELPRPGEASLVPWTPGCLPSSPLSWKAFPFVV